MSKGLKTALIAGAVIVVLCFVLYRFFAGTYNKMVMAEETVNSAWGQVQNVYQRRFDLIPNLVQTVKGYASHESQVFTDIAEARSKAGGTLQVSDEVLNNPEYVSTELSPYHELLRDSARYFFAKKSL